MKIITSVVNPFFIEIQYLSFKKFIKNEYEFIVFNDAKEYPDITNDGDLTFKKQIEDKCKELNIKCIELYSEYNISPSANHAFALNKMLQFQLLNPDKYLIIDSDMFLIDYYDFNKYNNYKAGIILQNRKGDNFNIDYIWPGLCYLDMTKESDFNLLDWNLIQGIADTGGMTNNWLMKQKKDDILFIKHISSFDWDISSIPSNLIDKKELISFLVKNPRNENDKFFCELYDKSFLHYRAGANWRNEGILFHSSLIKELYKCIEKELIN